MSRSALAFVVLCAVAALLSQVESPQRPGPQADGTTLLVSGWRLKPAGRQIPLGTLPMSTALSPDGRWLLVLNGGYMPPNVSILDTRTMTETAKVPVLDGWNGLTFSPNGKQFYVGGGSQAAVFEFNFNPEDGRAEKGRTFELVDPARRTHEDFTGDVALTPDGRLILAAMMHRDTVAVINPQSGMVIDRFKVGRRPYRILVHPDGQSFYVSALADAAVYHVKLDSGERLETLRTGPQPADLLWRAQETRREETEDGAPFAARVFVTAANTNSVYVFGIADTKAARLLETINVAFARDQPAGMTPSALALSKDAKKIYVVCSDANAVAQVDISGARSIVEGFVPTGWYPTAARELADGRLLVLNGKGARSFPNPAGPNPTRKTAPVHQGNVAVEYVGKLQTGSLSLINPFSAEQLDEYTRTVRANSPYRDELLVSVPVPPDNPIPGDRRRRSPIEHVIYIVKENRTYDQVLGDLGIGNGDPSLTLFPESVAPNHRKLAREFVLLDNFYVSADVSADGHNWSTSAIAPMYVQKMWPNSYGGRRKHYDYEGTEPAAAPPAGRIWTNALAAGLSVRNYGWFVENVTPAPATGSVQVRSFRDPALAPHTNTKVRGFDLDVLDIDRARMFIEELALSEQNNSFPRLTLIRIGNDHTSGTAAGKYSPFAAMADNDLALGMIVEAVSKSKFWSKTAIFVLEDDAQNGPDHVDSHRSPAYVISPYTRRGGMIDSTHYNTTSMLRTMELILGLRPMTHFDAAATPMWRAFTSKADTTAYSAVRPQHRLDERNPANAPMAAQSERFNFEEADRIDDDEMNEILWRAIKGTEPPAPVRSWFGK